MSYYGPHPKLWDTPEKEKLNKCYKNMKSRCYNQNHKDYKYYGGSGIRICEEWYIDKMSFINWALENGYTIEKRLHRKDKTKNYSPDNCEFLTEVEHQKLHYEEDRKGDVEIYKWQKKLTKIDEKHKFRKKIAIILIFLLKWCLGNNENHKYAVKRKYFRSKPKKTGVLHLEGDLKGIIKHFDSREQAAEYVGVKQSSLSYIFKKDGYTSDGKYRLIKEDTV